MDVASIASAYQGPERWRRKFLALRSTHKKLNAEAKPKILEALQKLGDARKTALFAMREEFILTARIQTMHCTTKKSHELHLGKRKLNQYET